MVDLERWFEELYGVTGKSARDAYRAIPNQLGLWTQAGGVIELTEHGAAWLDDPDPIAMVDRLISTFTGYLELLVILDSRTPAPSHPEQHLLLRTLLTRDWNSTNQTNFRRYWLMSAGLVDSGPHGDHLTPEGVATLERYPEEVAAIRARLATLDDRTDGHPRDGELDPDDTAADADDRTDVAMETQLDLPTKAVLLAVEQAGLRFPEPLLTTCAAALSSGKHLLLTGPPGTGKTALARALAVAATAEGYTSGLLEATASADWTTYDTIGGWALQSSGQLAFRPGVYLRALDEGAWLLVDELNRADVDRAFGELMTVLAGAERVQTPYSTPEGDPVSVGLGEGTTYRQAKAFRVIATMNTWDKSSLFRLSFALLRRFAVVYVAPLSDGHLGELLRKQNKKTASPCLDDKTLDHLLKLLGASGLGGVRSLGTAVALDALSYLRRRGGGPDALAEAAALLFVPQLDGLDETAAKTAHTALLAATEGASSQARGALLNAWRDLYPGAS